MSIAERKVICLDEKIKTRMKDFVVCTERGYLALLLITGNRMNLRGKGSNTVCFVTAAAEAAQWKSLALFKDVGKTGKKWWRSRAESHHQETAEKPVGSKIPSPTVM